MTTQRAHSSTHPADFAFASLLSGALGSAAVALFFLLIDSMRGQPFFTPSLVGSVVFLGTPASEVPGVRTDLMAAYTMIHFVAFTLLGTGATWVWSRVRIGLRHPLALATLVLAALTVGSIGIDQLFAQGLLARIGALPLATANTSAALVMGLFIHRTLEDAAARNAAAFDQPHPVPAHAPSTRRRS